MLPDHWGWDQLGKKPEFGAVLTIAMGIVCIPVSLVTQRAPKEVCFKVWLQGQKSTSLATGIIVAITGPFKGSSIPHYSVTSEGS